MAAVSFYEYLPVFFGVFVVVISLARCLVGLVSTSSPVTLLGSGRFLAFLDGRFADGKLRVLVVGQSDKPRPSYVSASYEFGDWCKFGYGRAGTNDAVWLAELADTVRCPDVVVFGGAGTRETTATLSVDVISASLVKDFLKALAAVSRQPAAHGGCGGGGDDVDDDDVVKVHLLGDGGLADFLDGRPADGKPLVVFLGPSKSPRPAFLRAASAYGRAFDFAYVRFKRDDGVAVAAMALEAHALRPTFDAMYVFGGGGVAGWKTPTMVVTMDEVPSSLLRGLLRIRALAGRM